MRRQVLVVEDNPLTRKMLRLTLESDGYGVIEAADGRSALEAVANAAPALVLQDLILPDMNGVELVLRLREKLGPTLPIIALSGFLNRVEDACSLEVGFTATLLKPVEPERLLEALRPYLPVAAPSTRRGGGRRVLLVDDEAVHLGLTRDRLAQHDFLVEAAVSNDEAMARAREHAPDVVLSTVLGAAVDGHQLCVDFRRDADLARVPIVLVSSWSPTAGDRALAELAGAAGLVSRNADMSDLPIVLLDAAERRAPLAHEVPTLEVRLAHARATVRQLQQQLAASNDLARRCTLQAAQISLLSGVAGALTTDHDPNQALRDVLAATLDAAGISKGALFLRSDSGALALVHALGFTDPEVDSLEALFADFDELGEAIRRQVTLVVPSGFCSQEVAQALLARTNAASAQVVPLVSDGRDIGAMLLCASNYDMGSGDSIGFARAMGNQVAQSLELARSFARLTASERRYRAVTEAARDAILILAPDGAIREVNSSFEVMLGVPRGSIIGRRLKDLAVASVDAGGNEDVPLPSTELDHPILGLQTSSGSVIHVEFTGRGIEVGGDTLFVSVGRDVTERLETQAHLMMSDRMASIGTLAAGVAHEINNPLMATTANLDMGIELLESLLEEGQSPELRELDDILNDARNGANRVRHIVRDLKIFSRAEEDSREPVDIEQVVESSLRMAWNEIRHRARLVREYSPVPRVDGSESRLGQVFLNLIVNAAQALPDGFAHENQITVRTSMDGRGRVVVDVEDTGPGIPPEVLRRLFTPFFTTKPRGEGTGIGLSICRRIVTDHGGEITVDSVVGRGTRFRVALRASSAALSPPSTPPEAMRAPRRGRLLIVDDDDMSARALARLLANEHDITMESDAEGALARLKRGERYDVILCDVMMPIMTGVEFLAELHARAPEYVQRVVFLTGGAFTGKAREFLAGVSCLDKPVDPLELRQAVNLLL